MEDLSQLGPEGRMNVVARFDGDCFERLSKWTVYTAIPNFLSLYAHQHGSTAAQVDSVFSSVNVTAVELPTDEIERSYLDHAAPYIYCYIVSVVIDYSGIYSIERRISRAQNLSRAIAFISKVDPSNAEQYDKFVKKHIMTDQVVDKLKRFLDTEHYGLLSSFRCMLTELSREDYQIGRSSRYIRETLRSLEYVKMEGVKLIEDYLITPNHFLCTDPRVSWKLQRYKAYKYVFTRLYGDNWWFAAVLDKKEWVDYSSTRSFNVLRIFASILKSRDNGLYLEFVINKKTVREWSLLPQYSVVDPV